MPGMAKEGVTHGICPPCLTVQTAELAALLRDTPDF